MFCQQCGNPTFEQVVGDRLRPVCRSCGAVTYLDPKLAVAVIVERDGLILLGRRAEGARAAGKWSFPAGFVERGERVEDAAVREVREEVGFDVELDRLVGLFSSTGEEVVLAVYSSNLIGGDLRPADDLDQAGWFGPDELPDLAFPHDTRIITLWRGSRHASRRS
jgi:8-oxo-dGTP diphosphatase